jgi:uridylate kinase
MIAANRNSNRVDMAKPAYRRIIVKLSGEALSGTAGFGIDESTLQRVASDLVAARKLGVSLGVVIGGGNFLRGATASKRGLTRETADAMGMLATVINALALESALERAGCKARTLSALAMPQVCESYSRQRALKLFAAGHIVIFAGGTGNPYFTTDTTAILRAAEMGCDAVLKATNVDGVYSADPKVDPKARRFDRLTHKAAVERGLKVMDATAFALARDNAMPIIVFSIQEAGAVTAVLRGKARATTVGG